MASTRSTAVCAAHLATSPHLHRAGALEVRIATSEAEIAAAQALRYRIFYEEMGARPSAEVRRAGRDVDAYDPICDHLLVIDHGSEGVPHVVGTYRLLRQVVASLHRGFYSAGEYDLAPLFRAAETGGQLLELGRSCVAPEYRNPTTISLLWRGIASYLKTHDIGYLFGCASLPGTDPDAHAAALSYLYHRHLAPEPLRARALAPHYVPMDRLPPGSYDERAAARGLPALIKGYLRVGAHVGDGAFVDRQFNTVDVFVVMPVEEITSRYFDRFIRNAHANDPA
ncbi:MAG: GNAT family N-acetyltransferase [Sphingomonadaceae bacterium]|uniref:GNAT family N-acetyltransferase n=1 Tax=Thermaurantiacus sp. TaxID=2820283 RepID=UPI00298EF98D|nr:GNAT family N-acyltransferase [Thermaurantiacus sp.]MCS6987437.1 GNAT family N-acetyltransferase [Sphingomonadaceae bacterium]MDW8415357.1 GNAT family N-acyltransferase [Thermaurantiacus sp.]